jgi:hypothetical protein
MIFHKAKINTMVACNAILPLNYPINQKYLDPKHPVGVTCYDISYFSRFLPILKGSLNVKDRLQHN